MRYQAKPVHVDAEMIVSVGPVLPNGSVHCALQNGRNRVADKGMLARFIPQAGDYWVTQADGYEYLNPKDVFERKYGPVEYKTGDVIATDAKTGETLFVSGVRDDGSPIGSLMQPAAGADTLAQPAAGAPSEAPEPTEAEASGLPATEQA